MKNKYNMTTLFLATALALSCNSPELTPQNIEYLDTEISYLYGDTTRIISFKNVNQLIRKDLVIKQLTIGDTILPFNGVKLHGPPIIEPDSKNLKNTTDPEIKNKPIRYLAVGSSLTAGVRDGGYFNEGIQTSYPNLIARQLRLQKFQMPLFDAQDYNGTGRKVTTNYNPTGGPLPKYKHSSNNVGVTEENTETLKKYNGGSVDEIDHWGVPKSDFSTLEFGLSSSDAPFFKRLLYNTKDQKMISQYNVLLNHKCDFFTLELGSQGWTTDQSIYSGRPNIESRVGEEFIAAQSKRGAKGCIANVPYFSEFPYYNLVKYEELQKALLNTPFSFPFDKSTVKIRPTSRIDSLLSPKVNINLKKLEIYPHEVGGGVDPQIDYFNTNIVEYLSKKYNYPIVDLKSLYQKILSGKYVTEDGIKVDAGFKGNFFSSDGIYPTAFGQAIIANEFIKTLNSFYNSKVPLIPTKEYLLSTK